MTQKILAKSLILFCFLILLFMMPLRSQKAWAESQKDFTQTYSELYQPVQEYFAAWNHQDPEELLSTFTEEGTYQDNVGSFSLKNRPEAVQFLEKMFQEMPGSKFTILHWMTDGEKTVGVHWKLAGVLNHQPAVFQGVDVIELEGNKIKSARGFASPD